MAPDGNGISLVKLGPHDRVAPNAVTQASIGATVYSNRVDLQWGATTDDANGIGVLCYFLSRNGVFLSTITSGTAYSDGAWFRARSITTRFSRWITT